MTTIHVITHTHWDREWFLPAQYTCKWLDDLFIRLRKVIENCPEYTYILDGQTLLLEDYLAAHPDQLQAIRAMAEAGNLLIGPYYGQVDWRAASAESLIRNLYFGRIDANNLGNPMTCGWMMDNFGHCSQAPQIHNLFGINSLYLWRGPVFDNDTIASDFTWKGHDNSTVHAYYLMSGYRNFYNLTDTTDFLEQRINQLTEMLAPFTPHGQMVFLNGYDLDVFPEDPFRFLEEQKDVIRSTPEKALKLCRQHAVDTPEISGELYSGKYACIFPGSLSTRSYLRLENDLVERLLAWYLEPLRAVADQAGIPQPGTDTLWRNLLKTQLHDNLGGVSVDQVHDSMEEIYKGLYEQIKQRLTALMELLPKALGLAPGTYLFMPSPYAYQQQWLNDGTTSYRISSEGTGLTRAEKVVPTSAINRDVTTFHWNNEHYSFVFNNEEGHILFNDHPTGSLLLEADLGDTYNADPEPLRPEPTVRMISATLIEKSEDYARLALRREILHGAISITTEEELFFNNSPLLSWKLKIDSIGKEYRLRFVHGTDDSTSEVLAGMPFAIEQRPRADHNLFDREVPGHLRPILLAAREIGTVNDFPFQGFVALASKERSRAVLARGLREYEVDASGNICITLKRSVEWIAQPIRTRVGDAGPFMYVPSAKDERTTTFELGLLETAAHVSTPEFLKWKTLFEAGFLAFSHAETAGTNQQIRIWQETLPWSGVQQTASGRYLIRCHNPYPQPYALQQENLLYDGMGEEAHLAATVEPFTIVQMELELPQIRPSTPVAITLSSFPEWPVGEDRSSVDPSILLFLEQEIDRLRQERAEAADLVAGVDEKDGLQFHTMQHTVIRLDREILELELSILLNRLKREGPGEDLEAKVREKGEALNMARRHRRTYDYILSLYE